MHKPRLPPSRVALVATDSCIIAMLAATLVCVAPGYAHAQPSADPSRAANNRVGGQLRPGTNVAVRLRDACERVSRALAHAQPA